MLAPGLGLSAWLRAAENLDMFKASSSTRPSRLKRLAWTYVAVAFVGTSVLTIAVLHQAVPSFVFLLWLLFLGPLGLVALVLSAASGLSLGALAGASGALAAATTVLYTGGALLNVVALRHLHRADRRARRESGSAQHRTATAVLYSCAAACFVLLTFLCGFFFLVAYGVDVPTSDPIRVRVQVLAGITWSIGLAAAVAGLIVWIRGTRKRASTLPWAVADLAVIVVMTALVTIGGQISLS